MSGPVDVLAVLAEYVRKHDMPEDLVTATLAVDELIEALSAIRDFRGELNTPIANSVKLRGIARAALANIGSAS